MITKIEEIFANYDYGFDLNFISADKWENESNHYFRTVYLEENEKYTSPIKMRFNVLLPEIGTVKMVFLDKI